MRAGRNVVVVSEPGSGKTTRVPSALLSVFPGQVLVLEPRRLAARLASSFVAREMGENVGETVGYQVRFETVAGPRTRLRFMTEGVLTRRLLSDPRLSGVNAVVLDEFHEHHLDGDLALALLRRLQQTARRDLRIVAMSATLDAAPVAAYLDAPIVEAKGRVFEVSIEYSAYSEKPAEEQVPDALRRLGSIEGHVLVFLPGAAEIRRAARACGSAGFGAGFDIFPLHGDLAPEEQDRAVAPSKRRKLILATNVAESSVTIEGVRAVVDSGLARIAADSPWTGLPTLNVARVSKASATQRAGRAGRTAPGRAIRLYTVEDFHRRAEHETPEIRRRELSQVLLDLRAMDVSDLPWLEAPPAEAVTQANDLLDRLRAGAELAKYPLHPRLARLLEDAGSAGTPIAALLSAGERLTASDRAVSHRAGPSDLLAMLDAEWSPRAKQTLRQIQPLVKRKSSSREEKSSEEKLLQSILSAFPDRVARRRQGRELLLASGPAELAESSVVRGDLMVAVDIEDRRERGVPLVRLASEIEPEWLLDLFPERITESNEVEWHRAGARVESVGRLCYDGLVISESRSGRIDSAAAAALLAEKAWEAGIGRFADAGEIAAYRDRVAFAAEHSAISPLSDEDVRAALALLCTGLRSFSELTAAARDGGLLRALSERVDRRLSEIAPETIRLPGGRQTQVHYPPGQPPWIESRLQDFFGMRETPRIALGRAPVTVKLLAPNRRPVQTTTDLAGFWARLYPQVRRELSRRYPRHAWPENPAASAPVPTTRRG